MTRTPFTILPALVAATALAGCDPVDFDYGQQAFETAARIGTAQALPATEIGAMPVGTVSYDGVAAFSYDSPIDISASSGFDLLADITLTADFDTNDVTGSLSNFSGPSGAVSGTVPLSNGAVAGNLMAATATGDLTEDGTATALDLVLSGQFRDSGATTVTGAITGTRTPAGAAAGDIFGIFAADAP